MKRMQMIRRYTPRFLIALGLMGMIVYTLYHVVGSSPSNLMTTPVRKISDTQILNADAYLFRDEAVLRVSTKGIIQEEVASGSKVGADVAVATVYPHADGIEDAQQLLDRMNRLISVLEQSIPSAGTPLSQAPQMRQMAANDYLAIRSAAASGDLSQISSLEQEMSIALNRFVALTDSAEGMKELLSELRASRDQLLSGDSITVRNFRTSGYFYGRSHVDGYESVFTKEALDTLTLSSFEALTVAQPDYDVKSMTVGKMVTGARWYLAIPIKSESVDYFASGYSYITEFSENGGRTLTLTCDRVITEEGKEGALAILYTEDFPADFAFLRKQAVKITVDHMSGYYIPDSALQMVDGVQGVYVYENRTVYFRKPVILYRGDGYCIASELDEQGQIALHPNDLLVTYAQNLYDGKVY